MTDDPNENLSSEPHPRLPRTRSRLFDVALFLILFLLPSLFYLQPLIQNRIPNFMDTVMYFFPLRVHAAHLLGRGEWPLWNRCLMGGVPLFENPQAALAYPLHWPALAWPNGFWFTFPMVLQLGLFGALTAWALRRMGAGRWSALWAGALALAGSYGWSRLQYGNYLNVLPWWPLWLGAAHAFARGRRAGWLAAGALAAALSILAGAHQLAAYGLVALSVYAVVMIISERGARGRWLVYWVVTIVCGLAIAAPGWLPQVFFIRETSRPGGVAAGQVLAGAIGSWGELLRALIGDWSLIGGWAPAGGAWSDAESSAAIGLVALGLAGVMPARGRLRRAWIACWLAAIVSILLSLRATMAPLLAIFPPAGIFHDPRRWLGVTQWLLILNAGMGGASVFGVGLSDGLDKTDEHAVRRGMMRVLPGAMLLALGAATEWSGAPRLTVLNVGISVGVFLLALISIRIRAYYFKKVCAHEHENDQDYEHDYDDEHDDEHEHEKKSKGGTYRFVRSFASLLLIAALALLAHATRVTTDLKTIPARVLLRPPREPLVRTAGLNPGQRFFTLDWTRAASYDYTRPDLTDWALPNLAMLWGAEDLGGYEPAQSERYRAFMQRLHAGEPWRQVSPQHFGLVGAPLAREALDSANIRAAIMPRFGLPLFFQPIEPRQRAAAANQAGLPLPGRPADLNLWRAPFPPIFKDNFPVRLLYVDGGTSGPFELIVMENNYTWRYPFKNPHPLAARDDLAAPPERYDIPRAALPGAGRLLAAEAEIPPQLNGPALCLAHLPPGVRPIDVFAWGDTLAALWQPLLARELAALMRYQGTPAWSKWEGAPGTIARCSIRANRLELELDGPSENPANKAGSSRLILHDAWWPGWRAWMDDVEIPVQLDKPGEEGFWRAVAVPPGRHTIVMAYQPPWVRRSLFMCVFGLLGLGVVCGFLVGRGCHTPPRSCSCSSSSSSS